MSTPLRCVQRSKAGAFRSPRCCHRFTRKQAAMSYAVTHRPPGRQSWALPAGGGARPAAGTPPECFLVDCRPLHPPATSDASLTAGGPSRRRRPPAARAPPPPAASGRAPRSLYGLARTQSHGGYHATTRASNAAEIAGGSARAELAVTSPFWWSMQGSPKAVSCTSDTKPACLGTESRTREPRAANGAAGLCVQRWAPGVRCVGGCAWG